MEIVGFYKELRPNKNHLEVILELKDGKRIKISILKEAIPAETIKNELHSIRLGEKIGILKLADARKPILIRRIRNNEKK